MIVLPLKRGLLNDNKKYASCGNLGAGSENRTRATRSEAWHSTTKLYPHINNYIMKSKKIQ